MEYTFRLVCWFHCDVYLSVKDKKECRKKLKFHTLTTYTFLRVKKLRRLGSSFWPLAGSVCERLGPADSLLQCAVTPDTQLFISASSCAWNKNSAPVTNLQPKLWKIKINGKTWVKWFFFYNSLRESERERECFYVNPKRIGSNIICRCGSILTRFDSTNFPRFWIC